MITLLYSEPTSLWGDFGMLELDATLSAGHTVDIEVTEHPVEEGAAVTDHARRKPRMYTCEGVISNVDLDNLNREARAQPEAGAAEAARDQLQHLADTRQLLTIVTGLGITYENMILTSLQMPESPGISAAIRFTATFKEITIARLKTRRVRTQEVKINGKVDMGSQPKAPSSEELRSVALEFVQDGLGLLKKPQVNK